MYRVVVNSRGKHDNVVLGARYCLTKRTVIYLAATFLKYECEIEVQKFIRIHGDIFGWSDVDNWDSKIWDKIENALKEKKKREENEQE